MGYLNHNLEKVAAAITQELEKRAGLVNAGKAVAKLAAPAPATAAAGRLFRPAIAPAAKSGIKSKLALAAKKMMYKLNEKALNYASTGIDPVLAKQVALPMAGVSIASKLGKNIFNGIKGLRR